MRDYITNLKKEKRIMVAFWIAIGTLLAACILFGAFGNRDSANYQSTIGADFFEATTEQVEHARDVGAFAVGDDIFPATVELLTGHKWHLYPGEYDMTFAYKCNDGKDRPFIVVGEQGEYLRGTLNANENTAAWHITIAGEDDKVHIETIGIRDDISLSEVSIASNTVLYRDALVKAAVLFVMGLALIIFLFSQTFAAADAKQKILWVLVIASFAATSFPLFYNRMAGAWDIFGHMTRIQGVADCLSVHQFPATVFPYNTNGYGILGRMYPSLFLYPVAFLRMHRVSITACLQLLFLLGTLLQGIIMYFSVRLVSESERAASLATIFALLFTYRTLNLYERAALGEFMAAAFYPLIIAALYMIFAKQDKNAWKWLVIGYTGVFQSHILSCLFAVIISAMLCLFFIRELIKAESLKLIFKTVIGTVLLNMFYLVPFVTFYTFGVNVDSLKQTFVDRGSSLLELIDIVKTWKPESFGIVSILYALVLIVFIVISWRADCKSMLFRLILCLSVIGISSMIFTSDIMPWAMIERVGIIKKFNEIVQFPYRHLGPASVVLPFASALALDELVKNQSARWQIVTVCALVLAFVSSARYMSVKGYYECPQGRFGVIAGGMHDMAWIEYYPEGTTEACTMNRWLYKSNEAIATPLYVRNGNNMLCQYASPAEGEHIDFPLLYYPGYSAKIITGEDMSGYDVPVSRGEEGRVRVELPQTPDGQSVILSIGYEGMWYFVIGYLVSALTLIGYVVLIKCKRGLTNAEE